MLAFNNSILKSDFVYIIQLYRSKKKITVVKNLKRSYRAVPNANHVRPHASHQAGLVL